jgi:hypothetical protein
MIRPVLLAKRLGHILGHIHASKDPGFVNPPNKAVRALFFPSASLGHQFQ